jgi:hypothetical protein
MPHLASPTDFFNTINRLRKLAQACGYEPQTTEFSAEIRLVGFRRTEDANKWLAIVLNDHSAPVADIAPPKPVQRRSMERPSTALLPFRSSLRFLDSQASAIARLQGLFRARIRVDPEPRGIGRGQIGLANYLATI